MSDEVAETDDYHSVVYEYEGKGASADIVAHVKKHHADKNGVRYQDLTGRTIASGGRRTEKTIVVVVE